MKKPTTDFDGIKWRYGTKKEQLSKFQKPRFKTGMKNVDEVFGGLPTVGLTTFWGMAGSGKSMMAKAIASRFKDALYVCSESVIDAPDNCIIGNYTKYLPNHKKASEELTAAIEHYKPKLVVIDSITTFFSVTNKAVPEADVRNAVFALHQNSEKYGMPIIAISEVRGSGNYMYPAGGMAVEHANTLLVKFDRVSIDTPWSAQKYGAKEGQRVYIIDIMKDKEGVAEQGHEFMVKYISNEIHLDKVEYNRTK